MAIIDIVKYEQQEGTIVHKFPSCDLRWGNAISRLSKPNCIFCKKEEKYVINLQKEHIR